ncbi:MAG: hypothetical protein U9P79_00725, partial [Candidatus Cloacimonadota bacterium]|nr:hypothetical protein [Candidatus Cloacimonadota bacterium]
KMIAKNNKISLHLFLFFSLIISLILSACSMNNAISTSISLNEGMSIDQEQQQNTPKTDSEVRLYFGYNFPLDKKLVRFATISVKGESKSDPFTMITEMEKKAREMGADAVVEIKMINSSLEDIKDIGDIFEGLNNDSLKKKILTGVLVRYDE